MRRTLLLSALFLAAPLMAAETAEKAEKVEAPKSGIEKGAAIPVFEVADVTGPRAPGKLCYIWANGSKPVVLIFAKEDDKALTGLVKKVNGFVNENKKSSATAVVVFLDKETDALKAKLKKLSKDEKLDIPLTINADGTTAEKFKLNDKVNVTVLIYRNKKVTANFAFNGIKEKDIEAVLAAAKETAASS